MFLVPFLNQIKQLPLMRKANQSIAGENLFLREESPGSIEFRTS